MSWDTYMVVDTGGECPAVVEDIRNVTYNNSRILSYLGCHPDELEGMTGGEAKDLIIQGINFLKEKRESEEFKKLEPSNGWGGIDDVKDFLMKAFEACKKHPKATLHFS